MGSEFVVSEIFPDGLESEGDKIIVVGHFGVPSIVDEQIFNHKHSLLTQIVNQLAHLFQDALIKFTDFDFEYRLIKPAYSDGVFDYFEVVHAKDVKKVSAADTELIANLSNTGSVQ